MAYGKQKWLAIYEDGHTEIVFSDDDGWFECPNPHGLISMVRLEYYPWVEEKKEK